METPKPTPAQIEPPQLDKAVARAKVRNAYEGDASAPAANTPPGSEDWNKEPGLLGNANIPQGAPSVIGPAAPEHTAVPSPTTVEGVVVPAGAKQPSGEGSTSPETHNWRAEEGGNPFEPPQAPPPVLSSRDAPALYESHGGPGHPSKVS